MGSKNMATRKNKSENKSIRKNKSENKSIRKHKFKKFAQISEDEKRKRIKLRKRNQREKEKIFTRPDYNDEWLTASLNNITVGSVFLGCIEEVTDYHLVVALPNRILGNVSLPDISKSYANQLKQAAGDLSNVEQNFMMLEDLYSVGEFLVVQVITVVNMNGKIKVTLTTDPSMTNMKGAPLSDGMILQCSVVSEIENGYIMETGLHIVRAAFLPKDFASQNVFVGKVLLCFIFSMYRDESTSMLKIRLSSQKDVLVTKLLREYSSFLSFSPGSAANVTVTKITDYGLRVKCGAIEGIVSKQHLSVPFQTRSEIEDGHVLRARVIYTTQLPNIVYFSTLPVICSMGTEDRSVQSLKTNEIVERAQVYAVDDNEIFLNLGDNQFGFFDKLKFINGRKAAKLKVGSFHPCRVLTYWPMDDIFHVDGNNLVLKKVKIPRKHSNKTLKVGEDVLVTIGKVGKRGIQVKIGAKNQRGYIKNIHTKKLTVCRDIKIPARVLLWKYNRLFLTLRDDQLNPRIPIVTEFDDESIGATVGGVVSQKRPEGLMLEFFNGATGFLMKKFLSESKPIEKYEVGNFVKCKVRGVWTNMKAKLCL